VVAFCHNIAGVKARSHVWSMISSGIAVYVMAVLCMALMGPGQVRCGELTIVYTGNAEGKLKDCDCPGDDYGGYVERATVLRRLKARSARPYLLVDGGDMVDLFGLYEKQALTVMRLMSYMGYHAALPGAFELFHGIGPARRMNEAATFPLVSATIKLPEDEPPFPGGVVVRVGEESVGIIGLSDDTVFKRLGSEGTRDYVFGDPVESLAGALAALNPEPAYIVVLSQLASEWNRELLTLFPAIDVIVETVTNERHDPPVEVPGGVIVSPGVRGQFVGVVVVDRMSGGEVKVVSHEMLPVRDVPKDDTATAIAAGKGPDAE
jgi:2',3'-cyclic-nucleotide 2'-phosphodiesterase (5'-nucleotidase family)